MLTCVDPGGAAVVLNPSVIRTVAPARIGRSGHEVGDRRFSLTRLSGRQVDHPEPAR
jgi:hypothetical protein